MTRHPFRALIARLRGPRPASKPQKRKQRRRTLRLETLEDRTLLSITPIFTSPNHLLFEGSPGGQDDLYLRATGGLLAYSTDGSSYTSDLGNNRTLTLSDQSVVDADVGGTVFLDSMSQAGGQINSTGPLAVRDGVTISTRRPGANAFSLLVQAPNITVGNNDTITALADPGRNPGDLQLVANSGLDLTFTAVSPFFRDRSASASISVGASTLTGRNVSLTTGTTTKKFADLEIDFAALNQAVDQYLVKLSNPSGTTLTFSRNGQGGDTISRGNTGSWVQDGFTPGMTVQVAGTLANNTHYTVASVTDSTLTLIPQDQVVSETVTGATVQQVLARLTGTPDLTFAHGAGGDTITRGSGSWLADGFQAGQPIVLNNTPAHNDGTYTIASVTDSVLTLGADNGLNADDTINRLSGSWVADGFRLDQTVHVKGTQRNDGDYLVVGVSDTALTLSSKAALADESLGTATITQDNGASLTGSPGLTFTHNVPFNYLTLGGAPDLTFNAGGGPTRDSITRSAGSFLADGFRAGQKVQVAGSRQDDGVYTVTAVSDTSLTLDTTGKLRQETVTGASPTSLTTAEPEVIGVFTGLPADKIPLVAKLRDGTVAPNGRLLAGDAITALKKTGVTLTGLADTILDVDQTVLSSSTSQVTIGAGATLTATQDVAIGATADADVTLKSPGLHLPAVNGLDVPIAGLVASSNAAARAVVQGGAAITAGNVFRLTTAVNNTLDGEVFTSAGIITGTEVASIAGALKNPIRVPAPSVSIAYGQADSESESGLLAGSTVRAGSVFVDATNTNHFKVAAESTIVSPQSNFGDGIGIAGSYMTSHALVHLDGSVTTTSGDVQAHATSVNPTDETTSSALVTGALFANPALNKLNGLLASPGQDPNLKSVEGPGTSQFGLAAGVAVAFSSNEADAVLGPGARLTSAGNVSITAKAEDDFKATASGLSFSITTPTSPGSRVTLGGAFVLAHDNNTSTASVGQNAVVDAAGTLTVHAEAVVPTHQPFSPTAQNAKDFFERFGTLADAPKPSIDTSSPDAFFNSLKNAFNFAADATSGQVILAAENIKPFLDFVNATLGINNLATTSADSAAGAKTQDGDGIFAFSGSADFLYVTNHATSFIDQGAQVNQRTPAAGNVTVDAVADAEAINAAGMGTFVGLLTSLGAPGAASDGAGIGTNLAAGIYDNSAKAYVADGVLLNSQGDVQVKASTTGVGVTLSQAGAQAHAFGLALTAGLNGFTDTTLAYVEDTARVHAGGNVDVQASSNLFSIDLGFALSNALMTAPAGTGGLEPPDQVGVGLAAGANLFHTTTKAFIGNSTTSPTFTTPGAVQAGGEVDVNADGKAFLVAGSVAGAVATGASVPSRPRSNDIRPPAGTGTDPAESGSAAQGVGGLGAAATGLGAVAGSAKSSLSNVGTNLLNELKTITATPGKIKSFFQNLGKGPANTLGVGISGDAGLNLITDDTEASITDKVTVTPGSGFDLNVTANSLSVLVGATLAVSVGGTSKGLGVAGSLVLDTADHTTRAFTDHVTLVTTGNVNVQAKAIDVDVSGTAGGAGAAFGNAASAGVVGSADLHLVQQDTEARLGDGTVVTNAAGVNVDAQNVVVLVSLSGGVAVGGALGAGASLDLQLVDDTTLASVGQNANVTSRGGVDVSADSSEYLLSLSGSLALGSKNIGLDGSAAVDVVATDTEASVGSGATVSAATVSVTSDDTTDVISGAGDGAIGDTAGVGASIAPVVVIRTERATIGAGAVINATNGVTVDAEATDRVLAAAGSGSLALNAAVFGSVVAPVIASDVQAFVDTNARLTTINGDVQVTAGHKTDLAGVAGGGGLALEPGAGVGAASALDGVADVVKAYVGLGASVDTLDLIVSASSTYDLLSVTAALAGGGNVAVIGSVATQVVVDDVEAYLDDGSKVTARGNVVVQADSQLHSVQLAGGAAVSGFQDDAGAGIGASDSTVIHLANVVAHVGQNATVTALGLRPAADVYTGQRRGLTPLTTPVKGLAVTATSFDDVIGLAVGAQGSANAAIAGSSVVNVLVEGTKAYVDSGARVNQDSSGADPGQAVYVLASNQTAMGDVAGAFALAATADGGASFGGGADVGFQGKDTEAFIAGNAKVNAAGDVIVHADSNEYVLSVAAAGSVGAGLAVNIAGAAGIHTFVLTTQASVGAGADLVAGDTVAVTANDSSHGLMFDGDVSAGLGGGGASLGGTLFVKDTEAFVDSGASVTALGNGSGVAVNDGNYDLNYVSYAQGLLNDLPPSLANLAGKYVTGGRDNAPSTGRLLDPSLNESQYLPAALQPQGSPSAEKVLVSLTETTPHTRVVRGVAVTATAKTETEKLAVAGGAGGFALTLSGGANLTVATTRAYVGDNARINQDDDTGAGADQSVLVGAGTADSHLMLTGSVALGTGQAAAGGAGAADVLVLSTDAHIGAALVGASGDVTVQAAAQEINLALGAGFAFSGGQAGLAGTVSVFFVKDSTAASINSGASVGAGGNVYVSAHDDTIGTAIAGAATVSGGVGVGASLGITPLVKNTRAFIDTGAAVTAQGGSLSAVTVPNNSGGTLNVHGVAVEAESTESLFTVAVAGAGNGEVNLAGALSAGLVFSTTQAYVGDQARVTTPATVHVAAINSTDLFSVDGTLAGSIEGGSLAGGLDLGIVRNNTTAYVGNGAQVQAGQDLDVYALSNKKAISLAVSAAAGSVGIGGAVSVFALGGSLDSEKDSARKALTANDGSGSTAGGYADGQTQMTGTTTVLGGYSSAKQNGTDPTPDNTQVSGQSIGTFDSMLSSNLPASSVSSAVSSTDVPTGTAAFIGAGAAVTTGGSVDVEAKESIHLVQVVGGAALGIDPDFGGVGFGGSAAVNVINSHLQAYIDSGASVSAGGAVDVHAALDEWVTGIGLAGGAGGLVGLGAQVALSFDHGTQDAFVNDNARIVRAGQVLVNARANRQIDTLSVGVGVAGGVAAGAAVAEGTTDGETSATLGNNVQVGTAGALNVTATSDDEFLARSVGVAAGLGASAEASVALVSIAPGVQASAGTGDSLHAAGAATFQARERAGVLKSDPNGLNIPLGPFGDSGAMADAIGAALALGAAAGVSDAQATVEPTVQMTIGAGSLLQGGGPITLLALDNYTPRLQEDQQPVKAVALEASGALLEGNGAVTKATSSPTVLASVGAAKGVRGQPPATATVQSGGDLVLGAYSSSDAVASSQGYGGGAVGVGVTLGTATVSGSTQALAQGANLGATGNVSVNARGTDFVDATTRAVQGGLLAGLGTVATGTLGDTVAVNVNGASSVRGGGDVQITAVDQNGGDVEGHGIDAGGLAVGVSQATLSITPTVTATVAGAVHAGGNLLVGAAQDYDFGGNNQGLKPAQNAIAAVNASSYAGVAIQANQARVDRSATVQASLADGAVVTAGRDLSVLAGNQDSTAAHGMGDVVGVLVGAGAVIARAGQTDAVGAAVGNNVTASAGGNLTVNTTTFSQGITATNAASLGLLAGSGSDAGTSVTSTASATVGSGSTLGAAGDVTVTTLAKDDNTANARGTSAGGITVGVSKAQTDLTTNVGASLGANDTVRAGGDFTLQSRHQSEFAQPNEHFIAYGYSNWPDYLYPGGADFVGATTPEGGYRPLYNIPPTTAQGSVGRALVGVDSADATSDATVTNHVSVGGNTRVTAGHDLNVTADSNAFGSSREDDSFTILLVGAGLTSSTTNLNHTNLLTLGTGVGLTAGHDLSARTLTANHGDAFANGFGRSGINLSFANVHTNVSYSAGTRVGDGDRLAAGNALTVLSQTSTDANSNSEVYGDGVVGKVSGSAVTVVGSRQVIPYIYTDDGGPAPIPADLAVATSTEIGAGASLAGKQVTVASDVNHVEGYAHSHAEGEGPSVLGFTLGFIDATANAEVLADTTANLNIDPQASIRGTEAVTLRSTHTNAYPTQYDFVGTGSFGDADTPDPGRSTAYANNVQQFASNLTAAAGSTIETPALTVVAGDNAAYFFTGRFTKSNSFGSSDQAHFENLLTRIDFNAHVVVDEAPRSLVVDPSGKVTADGIDYDTSTPGVVNVHDVGGGRLGTVTFNQYIVPPPPGDYPYQGGAPLGSGQEIHTQEDQQLKGTATFDFATTGGNVLIVNQSGLTLRVNKIDLTAAATGQPSINFVADPGTIFGRPDLAQRADNLQGDARDLRTLTPSQLGLASVAAPAPSGFSAPFYYFYGFIRGGTTTDFGTLHYAVDTVTAGSPGAVDVESQGPADVVLAGAITNPAGSITVWANGNIVEGTTTVSGLTFPGGFLEASAVALHAGGDVFPAAPSGVLVQLDEANNQEPTLTASAGGNLFLNLEGVALAGTTNPLTVHLNELSARGNIGVNVYQGAQDLSVLQRGTPVTATVDLHGMQAGGSISVDTPPVDLRGQYVNDTNLLVTDTLKANTSVALTAFGGSLTEKGTLADGAVHAPAALLHGLNAITAIGKSDNLFELVVNTLEAAAANGPLALVNAGDLTIQGGGLSAGGPIVLVERGSVTLAAPVSTPADVTLTSTGALTQSAPGDGVQGGTVKLLADGGIGSAAGSVVVATSDLVARSVNADEFLAADGTVPLTDGDALDASTATVHLTSGTFQLDGQIGSRVQVKGATLTGVGTVGGLLDVAGGTVDPGESVGTLHSGPGDVTFHPGGTFNADLVSPDDQLNLHDVLVVDGNVDLGGSLVTGTVDPGYTPQHRDSFTILQAQGNVTGRFGNPAQLDFGGVPLTVSYQPHAVALVVNHAPVGSPQTLMFKENDPTFAGTLTASDSDGDPVTFALGTAPTKGTVTIDPATGAFRYTPTPEAEGDDRFTFVPNDGISDGDPVTVTVRIKPVAEVPTLTVADARSNEGAPIALDIRAAQAEVDSTGPADLLAVTVSGVPSNVVLSAGTNQGGGTWALTPAQLAGLTLTSKEEGSFTLRVTATTTDEPGGTSASTGADLRVTVDDPAVVLTGLGPLTATEGSDTGLQTLATFTDPGGAEALADYSVTVDWGDRGGPDTGAVIDFGGGVFTVRAHHTYADEGSYPVAVTVRHDSGPARTVTDTVNVADADVLSADPAPALNVVQGNTFTTTVATFTDSFAGATPGDFRATVAWGDGTTSAGTVVGSAGRFRVVAGHTYTRTGSFPVVVTVGDDSPGATPTVVNGRAVVATDLILTDTADRATAFIGLSADERFVQALYLDELGRPGTNAELDGWVAYLHAPGGSSRGVAAGIEQSREGRTHLVKDWYFAFLGRQAKGGEEQGWVNLLLQGRSEETVLGDILGDPAGEFFQRAQALAGTGTPAERFVESLYLLLLDRQGSSAEVRGWVNAVPQLGTGGVARLLLNSAEFRTDLVEAYYNALLHRPADPGSRGGWVSSSLDATGIRLGLESSGEFYTNG